jgi:hypothetical protein
MVLTWAVRSAGEDQNTGGRGWSRRGVLQAAGLTAVVVTPLAGCDLFDKKPAPKTPDPLAPLISDALGLADRYDAAAAGYPDLAARLTPVAQAHRAHAAELARVTGTALPSAPAPSGSATGGSPGQSPTGDANSALAALRAAEQQGREAVAKACIDAPKSRAALLGSIAAARATHLEVLR